MSPEHSKPKILIVDDDQFLLDMYSTKFTERGFEVTTAADGELALDKIQNGFSADIYLIDVLMPKIDGFQLISILKEKKMIDGGAVIILSNLGQQEDITKGLSLGIDGYIVKATATPSEVVNKVSDIVSHHRPKHHD